MRLVTWGATNRDMSLNETCFYSRLYCICYVYHLVALPADHNHCSSVLCESKHSGSDIVRLGIVTWVLMPWLPHCQLNNANTLCSWLLQTHWSGFLIMLGLINIYIKEKIQSIPILYYFLFGSR